MRRAHGECITVSCPRYMVSTIVEIPTIGPIGRDFAFFFFISCSFPPGFSGIDTCTSGIPLYEISRG
jgi:hypothetical protein